MKKLKINFKKNSKNLNNLGKSIKLLRRIEKRIRYLNDKIRRKDAREKIILGGLVVKAGLREANKSFILGCLIHASKLDETSKEYKDFEKTGKDAFADMRIANDK